MPHVTCPACGLETTPGVMGPATCRGCGQALSTAASPYAPIPLTIRTRCDGAGALVTVSGDLIYPHARRLDAALDTLGLRNGDRLVLDLRALTDLDSAGLSSVLAAYVRSGRECFSLFVVRPPARVQKVFDLTNATQWLTLIDDPAQAGAERSR